MALDKDTLRKVLEDVLPVIRDRNDKLQALNRAFDHFRDDGLTAANLKAIAWAQTIPTGISAEDWKREIDLYEDAGLRR